MNTVKAQLATFAKVKDLKPLLSAAGPCLSVYMPLSTVSTEGLNPNSKQNELHWRESLRTLEDKVDQFGPQGQELLDSVRNWEAVEPEAAGKGATPGKAIAVFRSAEMFQTVVLDHAVAEQAVLGPHFYIRPLLAELVRDRSFYLLALSQKHTRLLYCTTQSSEEVSFPKETKGDFDEWMNQVKPDHTAVNNAVTSSAPGTGAPNALAPKGSDQNSKEQYLSHYYKQVDHGVNELLRGKTEPLVLCGVEYELPIYRQINSYPHLAVGDVKGAPNGLKSGEMHARALESLELDYAQKLDQMLAEWNHRVGGGASSRLKDVVTAAHDGRVQTLLLSDSQELTGVFDPATNTVKGRETGSPEDEDLINDAAVQTILHGGHVFVAPHQKMPNGNPLAAIFRY